MATETRTEEVSGLTDSLNRVSLNADAGDDNRLGPDGEPAPRTDEEYAQAQLTLRAIVSSKEAGVIIGKAGKNVADLRDETGVKAGVSKVVQGVHDRVLTVTGGLEGISKAYNIVAKGLLEGAPQIGMGGIISSNGTHREQAISHVIVAETLTDDPRSYTPAHLPQPNGNYHWEARPQDQAHSGCLRSSHGCSKGNASPINREDR